MILFVPVFESQKKEVDPIPKYEGTEMSLENYMNHKFEESGYKYEWNNGILEAEAKMKISELKLLTNLQRKFRENQAYQSGSDLFAEVE